MYILNDGKECAFKVLHYQLSGCISDLTLKMLTRKSISCL